jgi:hypothetical protein
MACLQTLLSLLNTTVECHAPQATCTVERQVIAWFEVDDAERFRSFPISIITDDLGEFYIFPPFDHPGLKVGVVCRSGLLRHL